MLQVSLVLLVLQVSQVRLALQASQARLALQVSQVRLVWLEYLGLLVLPASLVHLLLLCSGACGPARLALCRTPCGIQDIWVSPRQPRLPLGRWRLRLMPLRLVLAQAFSCIGAGVW